MHAHFSSLPTTFLNTDGAQNIGCCELAVTFTRRPNEKQCFKLMQMHMNQTQICSADMQKEGEEKMNNGKKVKSQKLVSVTPINIIKSSSLQIGLFILDKTSNTIATNLLSLLQ